jgi:hypothetical protein
MGGTIMNDDEKFFNQFQEAPRPEFAAALYKRINRPMNAQNKPVILRRMALSFAAVCVLLAGALLMYPPTRAQALSLLRQIGVFTISTEAPTVQQPTAVPPDPDQKPLTAPSAADAGVLAGFTVYAPRNLPSGYVQEGPLSILPNGNGKTVVSTYINSAHDNFILINQYQYQAGDSFTDNVSDQETVRDVEVAGHPGVYITGRMMSSPAADQSAGVTLRPSSWLRWEANGIVYSVISDALTFDEALQLAESLK